MRPTDENQHSKRPNLMSSGRRGGNDESILEMLERDAGRGGGMPRSRLALYGGGAAVAVGLVAALVWLARDQGSNDLIVAPEAPLAIQAEASPPRPPSHAGEATPQQRMPQAAMIVDEAQPAAKPPQEVPPLVLLTPPEAAKQANAAHVPALPPAEPASAGKTGTPVAREPAATEPSAKATSTATAATHTEARRVTKTATAPRAESRRPHGSPKPAAAPTRLASHHAAAGQSAKQKKQAVTPKPADKVDSDVALISAVIQHASNRANTAGPDCTREGDCAAKATPVE